MSSSGAARSERSEGPDDQPEEILQVVEHLDGRRRVVDGRGEGADCDVDHDPDGESRILLDGPLDAERDHRAKPLVRVRPWIAPVQLDQHGPGGDEIADRVAQHHEAVVVSRPRSEPADVDRLNGAPVAHHPDDASRLSGWGIRSGNDRRRVASGRLFEHLAERAPPSSGDERGDRHRPESMDRAVEEDDKEQNPEPQVGPGQASRPGSGRRPPPRRA